MTAAERAALPVELLPPDYRRARLTGPLRIRDSRGMLYMVPAGVETDFASIPRFFWRILPPQGEYAPAAVVHDYYYRRGIGTRKGADLAFLRIMEALEVPAWKRRAIYRAVRLFGRPAWQGK